MCTSRRTGRLALLCFVHVINMLTCLLANMHMTAPEALIAVDTSCLHLLPGSSHVSHLRPTQKPLVVTHTALTTAWKHTATTLY